MMPFLMQIKSKFDADMWQKIKQDTTSAAGWIYASINKLIEMEYENE